MTGISRNPLADRRSHSVFELNIATLPVLTIGLGYYDDGRVGEVFINAAKDGSQFAAECGDAAVMLSLALQHGISPRELYHSMHRTQDGEPATVVGHILRGILDDMGAADDQV